MRSDSPWRISVTMVNRPARLPTGTVTFFFSDVEGSTGLLQRLGGAYKDVIERHAVIVRSGLAAHGGIEVSTEGDSFFAVFTSTTGAVASASDIQQALASEPWPEGGVVTVRIGLHTGVGEQGHDNYVGIDVNRGARISAAGHGGQVVVSESVRVLGAGSTFTDLGEHALKGLDQPEHLYQLDIAGLPRTFPPLRTASQRPNNLPALASRIVGREGEQERLAGLIDTNRLVTLTGPGGIGKTRLALEVAGGVVDRFTRGVFLVDLTPVDDPELLLPAITTATGVLPTESGGLAAALSDGPRLLVLDNFEQLAEAAPRLATLMATAAPLKVLATSQVPLRIAGETVMRLEPLATTDDDSPAVALFAERARQADPSFDIAAHRDDVLRLVDILDGVPLAIELAAARVNVLTPADVLARLDNGVLKTSRADSPERHRSITAAVAWSYGLLTTDQQELLQALSVFRGGATLDAIGHVLGRDPLDDLGELIDRSLVETATGTLGKRFDMLTSVQLYAGSQINDDATFGDRHTGHFARLAKDALGPLDSDASARWVARLNDEIDNLRSALDALLEARDLEAASDMLGGAWRFFQLSGRFDELGIWLDRVFSIDTPPRPTAARARALMARGAHHYWRSEWREAGADYDAALDIARLGSDQDVLRDALLGALTTRSNAIGQGLDLGDDTPIKEQVRELADAGDAMAAAFLNFHEVATSRTEDGKPRAPRVEELERSVELMTSLGRNINVAHLRAAQAELRIADGDFADARRYASDGLDAAETAGDLFSMSWTLNRLAVALVELGEHELGTRVAGAADEATRRSGGTLPPSFGPITSALDRARPILGDTADRVYEEGREIGLLTAAAMARGAAAG